MFIIFIIIIIVIDLDAFGFVDDVTKILWLGDVDGNHNVSGQRAVNFTSMWLLMTIARAAAIMQLY